MEESLEELGLGNMHGGKPGGIRVREHAWRKAWRN